MKKIIFPELNDKVVEFKLEVSPFAEREPLFALGIRKCGSSIFFSMLRSVCEFNGVPSLDVAGTLFDNGIKVHFANRNSKLSDVIQNGTVYYGFRDFPKYFESSNLFIAARKVLLVRDPRDALVSEYFSNAYSHSLPSSDSGTGGLEAMQSLRKEALNSSLKNYIFSRAPEMCRTFMEFSSILDSDSLRIFKYENMVFEKRKFLIDVCDFFDLKYSDQLLDNILSWADVVPDVEKPKEFIRRVRPGDWLEKLDKNLQMEITEVLEPALKLFNYV